MGHEIGSSCTFIVCNGCLIKVHLMENQFSLL